jgi:hypothetical protein
LRFEKKFTMKMLCLKSWDQDGPAREHELEVIAADLFKQCLECEQWRQRAEFFASERLGHDLFHAAWTWGAAHIIDQCSRGKLLIRANESQQNNN